MGEFYEVTFVAIDSDDLDFVVVMSKESFQAVSHHMLQRHNFSVIDVEGDLHIIYLEDVHRVEVKRVEPPRGLPQHLLN